MANYSSPPAQRLAWDRDGSTAVLLDSGLASVTGTLSTTQMQYLNNEENTSTSTAIALGGSAYVAVLFPVPTDVVGEYHRTVTQSPGYVLVSGQYSTDTTTGLDGTWSSMTGVSFADDGPASYRTVTAVSWSGIRGVRYKANGVTVFPTAIHLYGYRSAAGDRVEFWNPATDVRLSGADFDFGDMAQGLTSVKQFRLKNRSTSKTATNIALSSEVLTDASPALAGQYSFSTDGSTYSSTVTVASLAAGAISPVLYLRRVASSTAALGPWAVRHNAVPASMA